MQPNHATTPYGRRPFSLAQMTSQVAANACPADDFADKWRILTNIKKSRRVLRLTDRPIAVIEALLSFHPERILTGGGPIIAFPSNRMLCERANGIAENTLRNCINKVLDSGLILRRDSPNGKRYARKGPDGQIIEAFGFDLRPLLARAREFEQMAADEAARELLLRSLRDLITTTRRDIDKMIAVGVYETVAADWPSFSRRLTALNRRLPKKTAPEILTPIARDLGVLADEIRAILEAETPKMVANDPQIGGHIQDSNPALGIESEKSHPETPTPTAAASDRDPSPAAPGEPASEQKRSFSLSMVVDACPDIVEHAPNGVRSWRDLTTVAAMVRPWMGISPTAWEDATKVLGAEDAAIALAAILQRSGAIKCPGGYLRALTDRARAGRFTIGPMLMALLHRKMRNAAQSDEHSSAFARFHVRMRRRELRHRHHGEDDA